MVEFGKVVSKLGKFHNYLEMDNGVIQSRHVDKIILIYDGEFICIYLCNRLVAECCDLETFNSQ